MLLVITIIFSLILIDWTLKNHSHVSNDIKLPPRVASGVEALILDLKHDIAT